MQTLNNMSTEISTDDIYFNNASLDEINNANSSLSVSQIRLQYNHTKLNLYGDYPQIN